MKLLLVAGARPNFMKIAPIARALAAARAASAAAPAAGARTSPFGRFPSPPLAKGDEGGFGADFSWKLVHSGQHYDHGMSKVFFDELEIPEPDFDLGAGSGSHAEQTARVMVAFEKTSSRPEYLDECI